MATESGGDETGDETSGPRDETDDKMAAMAGDEREFDENEFAALEGQRLVAEFRCGIY